MPSALRPALKALRSKVRTLIAKMRVASDSELNTCRCGEYHVKFRILVVANLATWKVLWVTCCHETHATRELEYRSSSSSR